MAYDPSVRLKNVFTNHAVSVYKLTLSDFIYKRVDTLRSIAELPNCGNTTLKELCEILELYLNDLPEVENPEPYEQELTDSTVTSIGNDILSKTIVEVASGKIHSVRLRNVLNDPNNYFVKELTLQDYLANTKEIRRKLGKLENCGKKTINELFEIIGEYIKECCNPPEEETGELSVADLIEIICSSLENKELIILEHRFGLHGKELLSLEELGEKYSVTRERVRQIGEKAVKKMSWSRHKTKLAQTLVRDKDYIASHVFTDSGIVLSEDLFQISRENIPPETALALKIVYGSTAEWLNSSFPTVPGGWSQGKYQEQDILLWIKQFDEVLSALNLPVPFVLITEKSNLSLDAINLCFSRDKTLSLFDGMIFKGAVGRRKRRVARLFRLLCASGALTISELISRYNTLFPDESCSGRDAEIVMTDAPHLFLCLGEEGWASLPLLALGAYAHEGNVNESLPSEIEDSDEIEVNTGISSLLKQILEENGPLHFVDLRAIFMSLHGGVYSKSSIGPILINNDAFLRLAPGVYGLASHLIEVSEGCTQSKILLKERDCGLYVMSRYAGEKMNSYPWWTPRMEYEWCKWGQQELNEDNFGSLLAVSDPHLWQVEESELQYWLRVKEKKGHYRIETAHKHMLKDCIPTFRDLYALAIVTGKYGSMNWVRANRVLGRRIDDNHVASHLCILIALGVLASASHWQLQHPAGERFLVTLQELALELTKQPNLTWSTEFGRGYIINIEESIRLINLGWVNMDGFADLIDMIRSPICCQDHQPTSLDLILNQTELSDTSDIFNDLIQDLLN